MDGVTKSEKFNVGARRATGPRTAAGKRRSRMNAIKHGLFSKHLLLEGEDPSEYERLHQGLRNDWRPMGVRETLEVEHLAGLFWRRRRCLVAETAVIARSPGFVGAVGRTDLPNQHLLRACLNDGSAPMGAKIALLSHTLEKLPQLAKQLATPGFNPSEVLATLRTIDGNFDDGPLSILYQKILALPFNTSSDDKRDCEATEATDFKSEAVLGLLTGEFARLLRLLIVEQSKDVVYTSLASLLPSQDDLDRVVRYESHLSREIDRTENRLERWQRERRAARSSTIRMDL